MVSGRVSFLAVCVRRPDIMQFMLAGLLIIASLLVPGWRMIALMYSNPNTWLHKAVPWLALAGAILYAILVFLLQMIVDMVEIADLRLDFVLPWNYRWQVPGPKWMACWEL